MKNTIVHSGLPRIAFESEEIYRSGSGGCVVNDHGKEYVDFILGYGSVIIGHSTDKFLKKFHEYTFNGNLLPGYTVYHSDLLSLLTSTTDRKLSAAFFKTGSEALTAALRLSSVITNKKAILRCGFLGWHDCLLGRSIYWHELLASPIRYDTRFSTGFRGINGDEKVINWSTLSLDNLEELIITNINKISCLAIDAYQIRFKNISWFKECIKICKKYDILIVSDETKTAGRVAPLGIAESNKLDVDFIVGGKSLSNGFPMSILFGKPELMKLSEKARITGTFSQELSAVYAALCTFDIMNHDNGYALIREITRKIALIFNSQALKHNVHSQVVAEVLFDGAMFELVFCNTLLSDNFIRTSLCNFLARQGILVLQGHPSYICLSHNSINYSDLAQRISNALSEWKMLI